MSQPARAQPFEQRLPIGDAVEAAPIATRFGKVADDPDRTVMFRRGLLGFADHRRYVLADIPGADATFKLLQSLDDPELSFVVLPLDATDGPIAAGDLATACQALAIEEAALAVLAIVTLRAGSERLDFTVNLRAPLLIDTARHLGYQYVLPDDGYPLRYSLLGEAHAG